MYKIFLGAWDDCQLIQASDGSNGDWFGRSVSINEKIRVIGAPLRIMTIFLIAEQCIHLHCRAKHGRKIKY